MISYPPYQVTKASFWMGQSGSSSHQVMASVLHEWNRAGSSGGKKLIDDRTRPTYRMKEKVWWTELVVVEELSRMTELGWSLLLSCIGCCFKRRTRSTVQIHAIGRCRSSGGCDGEMLQRSCKKKSPREEHDPGCRSSCGRGAKKRRWREGCSSGTAKLKCDGRAVALHIEGEKERILGFFMI